VKLKKVQWNQQKLSYKEFQSLDLFDPDKKVEIEQANELWRTLEKRFAEEVEGKVTIYSNSIIENSVFNKITIATLLENDKVVLNIVESK
jgi:NAD+--asparagine ADP-ribosyltransferase